MDLCDRAIFKEIKGSEVHYYLLLLSINALMFNNCNSLKQIHKITLPYFHSISNCINHNLVVYKRGIVYHVFKYCERGTVSVTQ